MIFKKRYHERLKDGVYSIFKTEVVDGDEESQFIGNNGLITVVDEPLVKQQLIELVKLCENDAVKVTLKAVGNKVHIEFW